MQRIVSSALILALLALTPIARAGYIINTGEPDTSSAPSGTIVGPVTTDSVPPEVLNQSLALKFGLESGATVSSIEAFFRLPFAGTTTLLMSVAADDAGGLVPGTSLFGASYAYTSLSPIRSYEWKGVFDLSEFLGSGTYWLVLEAAGDDFFSLTHGAADTSALLAGAVRVVGEGSSGLWGPKTSGNDYGIRISDTTIPEPGSLTLLGFGLGLVGLAASRRRRHIERTVERSAAKLASSKHALRA